MPSDIDNTIPADGVDVAKSPLRLNWTRARNELNHGGFITHEPVSYTSLGETTNAHIAAIDAAIEAVLEGIPEESEGKNAFNFGSQSHTYDRATHGSFARFIGTNIGVDRTLTLPAAEGLAADMVFVRLTASPGRIITVRVEDPGSLGNYVDFIVNTGWMRAFVKDTSSTSWWTSFISHEIGANINLDDEFRSSTHGSGYTVQASDRGKFLTATSAITFSFPAVSTLAPTSGRFFACEIHNASGGDVTLDLTGATNVTMATGDVATVLCRNGGVFVVAVGPNLAAV